MGNSSSQCYICKRQSITKPSETWCFDCHEELCHECSKHHRFSKTSNKHNTISIEEYRILPSVVKTLKPHCTKHNEKYTKFCKNHDCLCCDDCVTQSHETCKDWSQVDDAVRNVKNSNTFLEVEKLLEEVSSNIQNTIKDKQSNRRRLSAKSNDIERTIRIMRQNINSYLDKIETDVMTRLREEEKRCKEKINQLIETLTENTKVLEEFRIGLDRVKKCVPELEFITAMKEIESQAIMNQEYLDNLLDNGSLNQTDLSFKIDKQVANMFSSLHTFGEIIIETKPLDLTMIKAKTKQRQIVLKPNSNDAPANDLTCK